MPSADEGEGEEGVEAEEVRTVDVPVRMPVKPAAREEAEEPRVVAAVVADDDDDKGARAAPALRYRFSVPKAVSFVSADASAIEGPRPRDVVMREITDSTADPPLAPAPAPLRPPLLQEEGERSSRRRPIKRGDREEGGESRFS